MKKIILFSLLLTMSAASFSQQTTTNTALTKTDYLQKSKHQKTAAWVLLGGGSALIITGVLISGGGSGDVSFGAAGTGVILGGVGVLSALGSIPLFIASARNKRKGMNATAFFKMETAPVIRQGSFVQNSFPALSVKIGLK